MKKFTCLLVAFLAISSVYTACPATGSENSFMTAIAAYTSPAQVVLANQGAAGVASGTICNTGLLCCDATKVSAAVTTETQKVKDQYSNFGLNVGRFGALMTKVALLVNATSANTTIGAATTDLGGATTDQLKVFSSYSAAQYNTDFEAYKTQVAGCYDYHAAALGKVACHACTDATSTNAIWTADTSVHIPQASCNEFATKCNKVWNFMHKAGWLIQVTALLNKKKDTGTAVTYTALTTYYAPGAAAIADINTAITNCGSDAAATNTACTDTNKANLCKSFVGLFTGSDVAKISVGRANAAYITSPYDPTSLAARRLLVAAAATTGAVAVDATTGVDLTSTNTAVFPPTTAIVTITPTAWSSGYVAASGSTSSTSGTSNSGTKSSAKVVIGTILSALFAIAFLN